MKVKIQCNSPLLQKSLEYFLKDYLDPKGILITDDPQSDSIVIGRDIKKPFSKTTLLLQLEGLVEIKKKSFEEELDMLINDFANKLKKLIKEHYGKE
ncbi:MAG: hypothetical protein GXO62_05715 [Epsilonproteobacteria bacterium]|nr:hypothetical protein [Campylobacterota bacterium]